MDVNINFGDKLSENFSYVYNEYTNDEDDAKYQDTFEAYAAQKPNHFERVFIPVLHSLALVTGLLGNGLVLAVLCKLRRTWSVTDTFILHLAVADTLLLLTLPFWAAEAAQGWSFGTPLCKLMGAVFKIHIYCNMFLLACISLDCYLSIVRAVQMCSRRRSCLVQASCIFVWIFCILLSIPDWVFLEVVEDAHAGGVKSCIHNYLQYNYKVEDWRLASRLLYHIVGFLLPSVVMVFCYSCILVRLHRGSQGLQKQKAMRVILALVVAFFISWTPYNLTLIVDTLLSKEDVLPGSEMKVALDLALTVTPVWGYLRCSLNPLLFICLCVNFRRQLLEKLKLRSKGQADQTLSLWDTSGDSSPKPPGENNRRNTVTTV